MHIKQAMILAAGRGSRLRPITDSTPKPMVEINGRSLILRITDQIQQAGIIKLAVNGRYLARLLEEHLYRDQIDHKFQFKFFLEENNLETAGGVRNALSFFEHQPFFVINSDNLFDLLPEILVRMEQAWDPNLFDVILLVCNIEDAKGFDREFGDWYMNSDGEIFCDDDPSKNNVVFCGAYIMSDRFLEFVPEGTYSFATVFKDMRDAKGKLLRAKGVMASGNCCQVGDPEAVRLVEAFCKEHSI